MRQLVQLKELESNFKGLNVEIVGVLREEAAGVEGLKKAVQKTNFKPILLDTPIKGTASYSRKNYATYFIDDKGIIKAVLDGTKHKRPTGEVILKKAREVFPK